MPQLRFILSMVFAGAMAHSTCFVLSARGASAPPAVIEWVKSTAIPISTVEPNHGAGDLAPLRSVFGEARIVGLGEPSHGTREAFQMKHRLVEYLVREHGFSLFAIEANMPDARRLNDYVLGGVGDAAELIRSSLHIWPWSTEEVRALVEWMRRYDTDPENRKQGRRIEFAGFDMQSPESAGVIARDYVAAHAAASLPTVIAAQRALAGYGGIESASAAAGLAAEVVRGKRLVLSGWIRTQNVNGWAALWCRADTGARIAAAADFMTKTRPRDTTPWQRYEVTVDVPPDATRLGFGVQLVGQGEAWFDDLSLTIDGAPYDPAGALDLGFEQAPARGFHLDDKPGYALSLDREHHAGATSLHIAKVDDTGHRAAVLGQWHAIEQVIATHPAVGGDEAQAWAQQCTRLVAQSLDERLGRRTRDECMAENVRWLAERHPTRKIVLWAHNAHIARDPTRMGEYLSRAFGAAYVPVGFAAGHGEYRATAANGSGLGVFPLVPPTPDSVEGVLAQVGRSCYFLDLRPASAVGAPPAAWFAAPRPFKFIGAGERPRPFRDTPLARDYDALIYIDETHATVPLPR